MTWCILFKNTYQRNFSNFTKRGTEKPSSQTEGADRPSQSVHMFTSNSGFFIVARLVDKPIQQGCKKTQSAALLSKKKAKIMEKDTIFP